MAIANYLIAQYIPDLFRREPKNVGVITWRGIEVVGRFFGETDTGEIDGRKIKSFRHPDIYRQWVTYWRSLLQRRGVEGISQLLDPSVSNYRIIKGGEVSGTEEDAITDVLNYLYALIVSEGGLREALGLSADLSMAAGNFKALVAEQFDAVQILAPENQQLPLGIAHPIYRNLPIPSSTAEPHKPSFVQQNGLLYVMEIIDFSIREKDRAKDHAGLTSYMFDDLKKQQLPNGVRTIAIIRKRDEDDEHASVRYGMAILREEAHEVVNWLHLDGRALFLQERVRIARAVAPQ